MILFKQIQALGHRTIPNGVHDLVLTTTGLSVFDGGTALSSFVEVRDGRDLVIAPSFVDMHSHSDLYRLTPGNEGDVPVGDYPKVSQGCGLQVLGQDGYSAAPVRPDDRGDYSQFISGLDGCLDPAAWSWSSFQEYREIDQRYPGTKNAHLVGHSTLRRFVSGMAERKLTSAEIGEMQNLLRKSLIAGAVGMSTGLVYAPASFSDQAELFALASVLAEFDSVMFVHLRSESYRVLEAADEVAEVCIATGCRLHISHLKVAGAENARFTPVLIQKLDNYIHGHGLRLSADIHPYVAGSTMATVILPGSFQTEDIATTIRLLREPSQIARARHQILNDIHSWDNWWRFSGGWQGLRFASCNDATLLGRPLDEVIKNFGIDDLTSHEAFAWFFGVLADSQCQASIISFNNSEENIVPYLKLPYVSLCTDGLVSPTGQPHPRTFGAFPRLFRRFARELQIIDLETAVDIASVRGRQVLNQLQSTDFVVFDPLTLTDEATFDHPTREATGVRSVFVESQEIFSRNQV